MSELFDDEPDEALPEPPRRRGRWLVLAAVAVVVLIFLVSAFASLYTDGLWYHEVHYGEVFSTMLWTKVGLFLVFGGVMAAVVGVNMYLAYRLRPLFGMGGDASVERYRDAVTPIRRWLLAGVCVVVGGFAGTSAAGQWRTYLLWRNAQPFHEQDSYFHKDIGFYVFHLPWWHFVVDFTMAVAVIALIATAVVHYVYGGIRLHLPTERLSGAAQVQVSILLGIFVLAKAADYFLDRYDLVTTDHARFTGMNYAGQNAVLPARNILLGVSLICALLFFLNIWRRTWQLPVVGLALLALSAVLIGMIWPAIVQGFQVKPSEADKENSYIQSNIDATRLAYGLSSVDPEKYPGQGAVPAKGSPQARQLLSKVSDVPVVDPKQVSDTFAQLQQPAAYYSVPPVLDVDHYDINGTQEPLVLGVRELDQSSGIPASDQNWSNLHTVYTHGDGIIAAYGNKVGGGDVNSSGRLRWAEGINGGSVKGVATEHDLGTFRSQIYYGMNSPSYSIVGKASPSSPNVELGLSPDGQQDSTTYAGSGGVPIGGTFNRLMYSIKFGEPNFLLSGRVNQNSKVLYDRNPVKRVEKVAPWLTVDSDPYPAVVDGKVEWILDGYTTTDRYPDSQSESFQQMTDDSLRQSSGLGTLPTDKINYMRSAVKATVDAYNGTVTLYQWDTEDPILQTWMKAFPGTVQPKSAISPELKAHLRYPEDLFKVQRYQLAKYHVTDARQFYEASDQWAVPQDPNATAFTQPPYRMFTDVNGQQQWSLTSDFVPREKGSLAAYMTVDSDATSPTFGKIRVLETTGTNVGGPGQIVNDMKTNPKVRPRLKSYESSDTPAVMGNLLTVPVDDSFLYVQPVYSVRNNADSSFRILQFVIVSYDGKIGVGSDLDQALTDALAGASSSGEGTVGSGGTQGTGKGGQGAGLPIDRQIDNAIAEANSAFAAAQEAQNRHDTVAWAKDIDRARRLIARAAQLSRQRSTR
ncbi:MAG: UPF0182 family protein [Nocardioidaceae bacterium]|nr:UPF0182 family protein [Nocardioidaceae bacterium]MCL2612653.1 UPF0182 family protein [Nocardioidaceae bacterium]